MAKESMRSITLFGTSFLDVLANTIGGLAFLLILALLLAGELVVNAPEIMTEQLPTAYHSMEYQTWLGAREGMGKFRWSFGTGARPAGLSLDPNTGRLWGKPQLDARNSQTAQYKFSVVCAAVGSEPNDYKKDEKQYLLTVFQEKPVDLFPLRIITDANLPDAYRERPYPMTLAAEGGQPPYSWSIVDGALPASLTLARDGRFVGAPARTGEFKFQAMISTNRGETATGKFSLKVLYAYQPPPPLRIVTKEMPAAVAERSYSFYPSAEGGLPPYRWSPVAETPAWLKTLGVSGGFNGTPALADIAKRPLRWRVTDSQGGFVDSNSMELEVVPPPGPALLPLRIKTKRLPEGRVGESYSLAMAVEGGMPPYRWSLGTVDRTLGLSIQKDEGSLEGIPKSAGVFAVPLEVFDSRTGRARVAYELKIRPMLTPVSILTDRTHLGRVDTEYGLALSATGGFPAYQWAVSEGQLPEGLRLDSQTGIISGRPKTAGTSRFAVSVKDAEGVGPSQARPLAIEILTRQNVSRLVATTSTLPLLVVGREAETALACEGGAGPYVWRAAGTLPGGLSVRDGKLTGSARDAGDFDVTFVVTDSSGQQAQSPVQLHIRRMVPLWQLVLASLIAVAGLVLAAWLARLAYRYRPLEAEPLTVLSKSLPNARASCEYSVQLACLGGTAPYTWRLVKGELPEGLTLDPTGLLRGCPFTKTRVNDTIDMPFTVEVHDQRGQTAQQEL